LNEINTDCRMYHGNGEILPLFKKENRSDLSNYRQISLTTVVCKVMERMVEDNVVEHCNSL